MELNDLNVDRDLQSRKLVMEENGKTPKDFDDSVIKFLN